MALPPPFGVRRLGTLLLLSIVLAGCADEGPPASTAQQESPAPAPVGFAYPCGEGRTIERADGVCVGRIEDPVAQLSEPAIAMMPGRPEVLAIGVHVIGPAALVPGASAVQGRLYVTEDAGATWRSADIPLPDALPGDVFSDPSLAFDAAGVLHVSGLAVRPQQSVDAYAVSTSDLGKTWSKAVRLTEGGSNDRNWEAVGPDGAVYVSSHVCCRTSRVSWSEDGGATWTRLAKEPEGCYTGSPVAFVGGEPWLACYDRDAEGIRVHRLDRAGATLVPLGLAKGMSCIAPRILPLTDGRVLLTCYGGFLSVSSDGGATWSTPAYLADLLTVDDAWERFQVYWSDVDAFGLLHLTILPFHRVPMDEYLLGRTTQPVAHVVLDIDTLQPVQETLLTPPDEPERDLATPPSLVPILGDDWYGMAFAEDHGYLVWMFRGGIEYARVEPVLAT